MSDVPRNEPHEATARPSRLVFEIDITPAGAVNVAADGVIRTVVLTPAELRQLAGRALEIAESLRLAGVGADELPRGARPDAITARDGLGIGKLGDVYLVDRDQVITGLLTRAQLTGLAALAIDAAEYIELALVPAGRA